jgi:hypothetical protein
LRASDAEREEVAERLRQAAVEGRLLAEELEARLGAVFSSRTYGDLDRLVADLPGPARPWRHSSPGLLSLCAAVALVIAVPVVLLVLAAVLLVVSGVLALWVLWLGFGWWFFSHRYHLHRGGCRRAPCGRWGTARTTTRVSRQTWF